MASELTVLEKIIREKNKMEIKFRDPKPSFKTLAVLITETASLNNFICIMLYQINLNFDVWLLPSLKVDSEEHAFPQFSAWMGIAWIFSIGMLQFH